MTLQKFHCSHLQKKSDNFTSNRCDLNLSLQNSPRKKIAQTALIRLIRPFLDYLTSKICFPDFRPKIFPIRACLICQIKANFERSKKICTHSCSSYLKNEIWRFFFGCRTCGAKLSRGEVICMINRRKINLFDDVYFLLLVLQFFFSFFSFFVFCVCCCQLLLFGWIFFFLFFFTCRLVSHFFCVRRGKIGPGGRPL